MTTFRRSRSRPTLDPDTLAVLAGGWAAPQPAADLEAPSFAVFELRRADLVRLYEAHRAVVDAEARRQGRGGPWIQDVIVGRCSAGVS